MPTILIAEDSRFVRLRIKKLLTEHNYDVVEAQNGEEAVQIYHQVNPDAVLLDFAMPIKNGMATLKEIRSFDPQAKVIMLTALDQQAIILRVMQAGAKDFLTKPYDADQLIAVLQKVLG